MPKSISFKPSQTSSNRFTEQQVLAIMKTHTKLSDNLSEASLSPRQINNLLEGKSRDSNTNDTVVHDGLLVNRLNPMIKKGLLIGFKFTNHKSFFDARLFKAVYDSKGDLTDIVAKTPKTS